MKAIQFERFGGPEVLDYVDRSPPEIGVEEVLIETTAIRVNFPDIRERMGVYNRPETQVSGVELPHVAGLQVVGTAVETGAGVDPKLRGRKVTDAHRMLEERRAQGMIVLDPLR